MTDDVRSIDPAASFKFRGALESIEPGTPRIQVAWCVTPELVAWLEEMEIPNPYLLISIVNGEKELDRYLVPLWRETCMIEFRGAGVNTVRGTIVYGDDASMMRKKLIGGARRGSFDLAIYNDDHEIRAGDAWDPGVMGCHRIELESGFKRRVPTEAFPKKPSSWWTTYFKTWFSWLIKHEAYNVCSIRRRRMTTDPSYLIGPIGPLNWVPNFMWPVAAALFLITTVLGTVLKVLVAFVDSFLGFRGTNFKPIGHPLTMTIADVLSNSNGHSRWFKNKEGRLYRDGWGLYLRFYNPVVLSGLMLLGFLWRLFLIHDGKHHPHAWLPLWPFLLAPVVVIPVIMAVITVLYFVVVVGLGSIYSWATGKDEGTPIGQWRARRRAEREAEEARQLENRQRDVYRRLEAITCELVGDRDPDDVLPENLTPMLRVQRYEAKYCSPYSAT